MKQYMKYIMILLTCLIVSGCSKKEEYSKKYLQSAFSFDQDYCMDQMEKMLIETYKRYHNEA